MSELDKLCRILLDEQDLVEHNKKLPKEKLDEFNKIWKDINQDHKDAKKWREFHEESLTIPEIEKYREQIRKDRQIVKRLERLRVHPYNLGERMIELAKVPVMERDILRQKLARLLNQELQKILNGKK